MQGLMGNYLEKTMQSFVDIHGTLNDQSKNVTGGADAWSQVMNMQNPMMQGLMGNYMEQSKELFMKMQEQMQGSQGLFKGFPFTPPTPKKEND